MIRNFAIIAHVDDGKSTLADRLLELTGVVKPGKHEEQLLDRNPVSRERGITIKLAPVRMQYGDYTLNLIDTPGHVDFSYEVDRTLACVEGVILLVDATQGVQAQTIANAYKALEKNLVIIPAVNKIDMAGAEVEKTKRQLVDFLGVREDEIFSISAKTGVGVKEILDAVIEKIPPPKKTEDESKLQALIFDSYYDTHKGVIAFVRVFSGKLEKKMVIKMGHEGHTFIASEVGMFRPDLTVCEQIQSGEIGYIATNLKDIHAINIGDTMQLPKDATPPLPGYKKVKPMVYASMFPTDTSEYLNLKKARLYLCC